MPHRSDTGPFALIPVWVLDLPISHLAVRVYAVHADWADRGGCHHHGRKAIAERLGCSVQAVDDAHRALVAAKALKIERRRDAAGDPTSNRYWVCRVAPGVAKPQTLPSQVGDATGSQVGDALTSSKAFRSLNHRDVTLPPPLTDAQKAHGLAQIRQLRNREETA